MLGAGWWQRVIVPRYCRCPTSCWVCVVGSPPCRVMASLSLVRPFDAPSSIRWAAGALDSAAPSAQAGQRPQKRQSHISHSLEKGPSTARPVLCAHIHVLCSVPNHLPECRQPCRSPSLCAVSLPSGKASSADGQHGLSGELGSERISQR